ncbi:MAG: O-antigen ligase family protein, partial [Bacillota bacterium]|nr:O-antigen ligase family protein [Bacillota bacterium]
NGSLGPYLAVVAGLVFSGLAAWRLRIPVLGRILTAIGCFIGVTAVMNLLEANLIRDLLRLASDTQHIATGSDKAPSAGSGRWILWTNGLRMALERPLLGYGPDNLGAAYREAGISIDRPHNEFIQIAASLGWPALLLYVSALVSHAINFVRTHKTVSAFECGLFAIVLTYLVSSIFGNTMFYTSPFFFLIFGLSVSFQKFRYGCQQYREEPCTHHGYNYFLINEQKKAVDD